MKPTPRGLKRLERDVMAAKPIDRRPHFKDCPICGDTACNSAECADRWADGYRRCRECGKLFERPDDLVAWCSADCFDKECGEMPPIPHRGAEWHQKRKLIMGDEE